MKYPFTITIAFVVLLAACSNEPEFKGADLLQAARVNTQLGVDYMRKGQMDQAEEKLRKAVEQDPNYATAHSMLALILQNKGDAGGAEKEYRRALALDTSDPVTLNIFGTFLCGQNQIAEAEPYFLRAAKDPKYETPAVAWTNAGVCVRHQDLEKAEQFFRQALEINPSYPDALAQMAWLTYQKNDYWRARAFLQRYEKVGAPTAETLYVGQLTEQALGDSAAANAYYKRLKSEFPSSEEAAKPFIPAKTSDRRPSK